MTAVILAGGENRRFPKIKGFIKSGNSTIIERNLVLLGELFDEVFINMNMPKVYSYLGVPLIGDVLPSRGPMSGIHSSLLHITGDSAFIVACDMPFIRKDVISLVCKRHLELLQSGQSGVFGATVPIYNGESQPLLGVYRKTILPKLEDRILNKKTSLRRFLYEIKTNFINESDIREIDPDGRSFVNINTPKDYEWIIQAS